MRARKKKSPAKKKAAPRSGVRRVSPIPTKRKQDRVGRVKSSGKKAAAKRTRGGPQASKRARKKAAAPARKKATKAPVSKRRVAKKAAAKRPLAKKTAPPARRKKASAGWANLAAPKRHGLAKDFGKRARSLQGVVYVSPTTGQVIESPRKNQKVLYAHRDADGKLRVIHPTPQKPDAKLKAWLKGAMKKSAPVVFVQRALSVVRPPKSYKPRKTEKIVRGVLMRRKPRESTYYPVHDTKLARPTTSKKQQAVLFRGGKARPIEGGRAYHSRDELKAYSRARPVQPGRMLNIEVKGATIWDSLKSVLVDKALKRLKPWEELFYEYVIIYRDPVTGEKHTIPGRGRQAEPEASMNLIRRGEKGGFPKGAEVAVKRLQKAAWPIASQIARSIRLSLAESGVRFSSAYTLSKLVEKMQRRMEEEEDDRAAANLNQALIGTEYFRPITSGGRVLQGERFDKIRPLRPERGDGRMYKDVDNALRVMLRLTIIENKEKKREWNERQGKPAHARSRSSRK